MILLFIFLGIFLLFSFLDSLLLSFELNLNDSTLYLISNNCYLLSDLCICTTTSGSYIFIVAWSLLELVQIWYTEGTWVFFISAFPVLCKSNTVFCSRYMYYLRPRSLVNKTKLFIYILQTSKALQCKTSFLYIFTTCSIKASVNVSYCFRFIYIFKSRWGMQTYWCKYELESY